MLTPVHVAILTSHLLPNHEVLYPAICGCLLLQGMRTFVAGNSPAPDALVQEGKKHNETWSYYPDDVPLRSLYGGDTRAALVPYLAHAAYGDTYKWLLYGDDDTVWFPESVMKLLEDFDPDLPYFITGIPLAYPYGVFHGSPCNSSSILWCTAGQHILVASVVRCRLMKHAKQRLRCLSMHCGDYHTVCVAHTNVGQAAL